MPLRLAKDFTDAMVASRPSGYKLICNKVCTERPGYIHSKKVLLVKGLYRDSGK